jgi:hypothetical protein
MFNDPQLQGDPELFGRLYKQNEQVGDRIDQILAKIKSDGGDISQFNWKRPTKCK